MVKKSQTASAWDPLELTADSAAYWLEKAAKIRFSIHFRPCAKKNETKPARIATKGRRVYWKVVPTARSEAHEDAIAGLALCELAWARGQIGAEQRDFFRTMAAERAEESLSRMAFNGLLEPLRARRDRKGIPFGRDLVELEIVEHVGKEASGDWLAVSVTFLEARPSTKRRTGLAHDLINLHAIVGDAIRGILVEDDDQVVSLAVSRVLD